MTSNTVTANTAQVLKCSRKVSKSCRSRAWKGGGILQESEKK
jgi:hypothetical protein